MVTLADELRWAIGQMREAGYDELAIGTVCDRFASCAINQIGGHLGVAGHPTMESLDEFIGFVFGHAVEDLLYMGFDDVDGRGVCASVPIEFLL